VVVLQRPFDEPHDRQEVRSYCVVFPHRPGTQKGHYLIYALADLDKKTKTTGSILDKANRDLLAAYLPLAAQLRPDDPQLAGLAAALQKGELPAPHRALETSAVLSSSASEPFAITLGANRLRCVGADGRTWKATLKGDDFSLDLTLRQPARPAMLVGGTGKTGLARPDDMFYVSLTRMAAEGTLRGKGGKPEAVSGTGWLDRQWGTSWVVQDTGWDWFGLQLSDGSDLIVYRVRDNATGAIRRAEATLLRPDGTQVVDSAPVFAPSGAWTDRASGIVYPATFRLTLPALGLSLTTTPVFPNQTIPVVGIGDAIWEGAVNVTGRTRAGAAVTGRGYSELVGYRAPRRQPVH
jgi:predicted secreted hydrolase